MAAKKTPAPLYVGLLKGLDVKSRPDNTVHSVRVGKKVVAEVCVGKKATRLNLKNEASAAHRKVLSGKSKSWPGGGMIVTADNVALAREVLDAAITKQLGAGEVAPVVKTRGRKATAAA